MRTAVPADFRSLLSVANTLHPSVGHPVHGLVRRTAEAATLGYHHDHLADSASALEYMRRRGETISGPLRARDLAVMRQIRSVMQAFARADRPRAERLVTRLLRSYQYHLSRDGELVPEGVGWAAFLGALMIPMIEAQKLGRRLKLCANPDCRVLIIDRSTAQRRRWCAMSGCGNRLKVRRYRARLKRSRRRSPSALGANRSR